MRLEGQLGTCPRPVARASDLADLSSARDWRWPVRRQAREAERRLLVGLLLASGALLVVLAVAGMLGIAWLLGTAQPRPAGATNALAVRAVTDVLDRCLHSTSLAPAGCPEAGLAGPAPGHAVSDVRWTPRGDLVGAASLDYDPWSGLYTVTGPLLVHLDYYDPALGRGVGRDLQGRYTLTLRWDRASRSFSLVSARGQRSAAVAGGDS